VMVRTDAQTLHVIIEDDGIGFDPADVERPGRRRGLGLLGMRERIAQLRGRIEILSVQGRGTRIDVELPRIDRPSAVDDFLDERLAAALALSRPEVDGE